ncbi:lasso peptide biosynthesis PqqD family chaperone [Clostridium sp.]|uniref:lasso peptide biosynthesis PqqD family chaperone n=1 Tax=Clostridium sp. TaxID=1506 RepID=UPI003216EF2D
MNIKKLNVKSVKIKKNYGVALDSVITRNSEIDATDLDGEVVMMNLDKGQYFMMNQVGSRIWEIIGEPIKVSKVIDTLLGEFEVEGKECEETVVEFLGKLKYAELISAS